MDIRKLSALALGLSLSSMSLAVDGLHHFWIDKTYENLSKIENYQAQIQQQGIYQELPVTTKVQFQSPESFFIQVAEPEQIKGLSISFSGNQLAYHFPQQNYSLLLQGLPTSKESTDRQRVEDMYWFNNANYKRTFTPSIEVAERISVGVDMDAQESDLNLRKTSLFIDYDYSIIMQGSFEYSGGAKNQITTQAISFNQQNFKLAEANTNEGAVKQVWNFAKADSNEDKVVKVLGKDIRWPSLKEDETWQLANTRYLVNKKDQSAASLSSSDHYFLAATVNTSSTDNWPLGTPIALSDQVKGQLLQSPSLTSLHFVMNNKSYQLFSNIHAEDLIKAARNMLN